MEAKRASMKLQENSGQKSKNNFIGIFVQTMKPKGHFEIYWPLPCFQKEEKVQDHV